MGKFDGILLATDLDGTLAKGFEINKVDIDAIEYFKSEGGLFTIATGRVHEYLKKNFLGIIKPNAPIITLNGAVIFDSTCTELLYKSFIKSYSDRFNTILSYSAHIIEFYIYYDNCKVATTVKIDDYIRGEYKFLEDKSIYKIVFAFKNEKKTIEAMNFINQKHQSDGNICLRSWPTGLELLCESNTKDSAVNKVKSMTGAKILVCAGDFENDIPMIKTADIGYAVGNAVDEVKASADRISAEQKDGAIAFIIKELSTLL